MKMRPTQGALVCASILATLTLSGCGGSSNNNPSSGDDLVTVGENQVAVYFNQNTETPDYDGWGLHIWNGDDCPDGYSQAMIDRADSNWNNWDDPFPIQDVNQTYGAYWVLDINPDASCAHFIIHKGNETGTGSENGILDLAQADGHVFTFQGFSDIHYSPIETPPVAIAGASAHMTDANTLRWNAPETATQIMLLASSAGDIALEGGEVVGTYNSIELSSATAEDNAPNHLKDIAALTHNATNEELKAALKTQLIVVAMNDENKLLAATKVQIPLALDALYTSGDNDADEAELGSMISAASTVFSVWAPTATQVNVLAFDADKNALSGSPFALTEDPDTGIWSADTDVPEFSYYQYEVSVYHPTTGKMETLITTDPYSLSLSMNSVYSQVVDLEHTNLKPAGWDNHSVPLTAPQDIVIYESHIRDFSAFDATVSAENRGKYLAFTETNSTSMQHIKELRDAGLTHFHLMPAFDIATINEDPEQRVDISDTVGKLCGLNSNASVCSEDSDTTLISLLEACDSSTQCAETIVDDIRGLDSFNWGYDPYHYGAPEGSYASDAEGTTRIVEFREMVQSLHEQDLNVVMDVVYNHTNASGINEKSVLDKVVPGYYHRLNVDTGSVEQSTCCDNTATEHRMMAKLMTDTLVIWAEQYKIDSFRFDLMGHQPLEAMKESLEAVHEVSPHNYFYGEGWNYGEVENDTRFVQATQLNLNGTGIGSFSDRLRDAVRGGGPFDSGDGIRQSQGLGNGLYTLPNNLNTADDAEKTQWLKQADIARVELSGNLAEFVLVDRNGTAKRGKDVDYNGQPAGYTANPTEVQSYVSKHDNQTLWDNNQYKLPTGLSAFDRARMQNLSLSFPLLGQGIPFIHMGADLLRSKSMERDSYDSGDWFNTVDFDGMSNNWDKGLPRDDKDGSNYDLIKTIIADTSTVASTTEIGLTTDVFREYLAIRSGSKLFGLGTGEAVMARVDYHNTGSDQIAGLIVQSIDDGVNAGADLDPNYDAIVVIYNLDSAEHTVDVPANSELHPIQQASADADIRTIDVSAGQATVPAFTTAVIVVPQNSVQGAGIPVSAKDMGDIAPFGDTKVYIRGDMNGWDPVNEATFTGNGIYQSTIALEAGDYAFKFADATWGDVNYDFSGIEQGSDSLALSDKDGNILVTIANAGLYTFNVDASDTSQLKLNVEASADTPTFGDTAVYMRGSFDSGWAALEDYKFTYQGLGIYNLTAALTAGDVNFKIADDAWGDVNYGQDDGVVTVDTPMTLEFNKGDVQFNVPTDGNYTLTFDALNLSLTLSEQ
ncbi:pullulanase-type alpha-1,6-glucosidase [Echinimonas agarilytica]|uniref:Pullulanase-type alpha-1,6-glucosidase n=1 Tax=Echinimonas agarilytica TaxID=1215918 RepID=A0AA41W7F8_9GAMM|nr:pullulanase-type alpha-1,6-glucosidase [Echinimonas agarilytica]MCM2679888.1 pullulanase-type alpha-1,6-glucosidase [Echinimonas agarilytica]